MSCQLSKHQFWYMSAAVANCWIDDRTERWWAKSRPCLIATGLAKVYHSNPVSFGQISTHVRDEKDVLCHEQQGGGRTATWHNPWIKLAWIKKITSPRTRLVLHRVACEDLEILRVDVYVVVEVEDDIWADTPANTVTKYADLCCGQNEKTKNIK